MYIVGVDIGKRNHEASIMNEAGKQVRKGHPFCQLMNCPRLCGQ